MTGEEAQSRTVEAELALARKCLAEADRATSDAEKIVARLTPLALQVKDGAP